jgi:hypothetical protein
MDLKLEDSKQVKAKEGIRKVVNHKKPGAEAVFE